MMPHVRRNRPGFTLVEALVVVGILSILAALTLAGVQKVRAAAARASCQNNLRQLGLGLHSYESTHGRFPAYSFEFLRNPRPGNPYGDQRLGFSALSMIAEHIEQENLARRCDRKISSVDPINMPPPAPNATNLAGTIPVKLLVCPSTPNGLDLANYDSIFRGYPGFPTEGFRLARTDYWPLSGFDPSLLSATRCGNSLITPNANAKESGALAPKGKGPHDGNPATAIADGTSNTLFLTEIVGRGVAVYVRGRPIGPVPSHVLGYSGFSPAPVTPQGGDGTPGDTNLFTRGNWADPLGASYLRGYELNAEGNSADATRGCRMVNVSNHGAPYSFHPGGVNVLRCDGSVFFLREGIEPSSLIALITRSGGEAVSVE